jgi:hypothetical protein
MNRRLSLNIIFPCAWLITMNERRDVLEKASVCVEKGRIAAVSLHEIILNEIQRKDI